MNAHAYLAKSNAVGKRDIICRATCDLKSKRYSPIIHAGEAKISQAMLHSIGEPFLPVGTLSEPADYSTNTTHHLSNK